MEEFYNRYLRECKECLVSPLECVTSQLLQRPQDAMEGGRVLDLSSYNFSPQDCNALAKVLSYDRYFKEVNFSDCLLSEEASKILLYGLSNSRTLERIDLKGNNLRSSGAEVVGVFLRKNTSVRHLRLEWNSLGLWGTGMEAMAEGLAINQTLVSLDLRNNQISHEGANELASCLKRNATLKALDLRWNNVGLLGGRALLTALQYNKCLTSLELQGNNIPHDILKAIGVAVKLNNDRETARNQEHARTKKIMQQMERIELEKTMQVSMLQDKLEEQVTVNDELTRSSHNKIVQLKEALQKNQSSFDELSKELLSAKSELKMSQAKSANLDDLLGDLNNTLAASKEKTASLEKQLDIFKQNKSSLENKVGEMTKKESELGSLVTSLENQIVTIKSDHKTKLKQIEAKYEELMARAEEKHAIEMKGVNDSFKERESMSKIKIELLEKGKTELEEKASHLRSELVSVKLKAEEETVNIKSQLRHEQLVNAKQYEDRIAALQTSRDEQHSLVTKYLGQITELQADLSLKRKESEQYKQEKEDITREMLRKEGEYRTEISRLKIENDSEKRTQDELRDKIVSLDESLKDSARKHREGMLSKDREIENLEEKLQARETDLRRQREEEVRRAELLESAIFTYVSSTRASRPPSPCK